MRNLGDHERIGIPIDVNLKISVETITQGESIHQLVPPPKKESPLKNVLFIMVYYGLLGKYVSSEKYASPQKCYLLGTNVFR